ncbi:MAG: hypothetical protein IPK75_16360 [Acidobacteria bacterium]|nr:hypothetical protein [Acidobacteriota bacterium]
MMKLVGAKARLLLAGAGALALAGCETADLEAFAAGLDIAAEELSITMTMTPQYGCDYNTNGYLVCDDTGDGYADRYGDPAWDYVPAYYSGPPVRINDYGEAYQYEGGCDCWRREPSLDTYPE